MACRDCLGRTPWLSLLSCIIVVVGMGFFCGALYRAVNITVRGIFEELFWISVPWLESIQIIFLIVAVVMAMYAVLLVFFGYLATGATRQYIYSGAKCIMGGRVSAGFFLVLTHILNMLWVVVSSSCVLPILVYVMLSSICMNEYPRGDQVNWEQNNFYGPCLNLSRFGIYINYTDVTRKNALCEDYEIREFCDYVEDAGPLYTLAFGASLLICCGMIMFVISLASNYQHIKISKELTDYRDVVDVDFDNPRTVSNSNSRTLLT